MPDVSVLQQDAAFVVGIPFETVPFYPFKVIFLSLAEAPVGAEKPNILHRNIPDLNP